VFQHEYHDLNLNVSSRMICRGLKSLHVNYKKLPHMFTSTCRMRQKREEVIRQFIKEEIRSNTVIFADEKLMGLIIFIDGHRKISYQGSSNRLLSPVLMVLAMIMSHGLVSYEIMKAKQKSSNYVDLIKYKALHIIKRNAKNDFLFQLYNYPIHISMESLKFFKALLDWPP